MLILAMIMFMEIAIFQNPHLFQSCVPTYSSLETLASIQFEQGTMRKKLFNI
jgi:hypothetical protein